MAVSSPIYPAPLPEPPSSDETFDQLPPPRSTSPDLQISPVKRRKINMKGTEEATDEQGNKRLVTVNFVFSLPSRSYSSPRERAERLLPTFRALSQSIDDAVFMVLDRNAFPVEMNRVGFAYLPHIPHPPEFPLDPHRCSRVPDDEDKDSAPSNNAVQVARFYSSNFLNTWVPQSVRDTTWAEWLRLANGRFSGIVHSYSHLLETKDGPKKIHWTDVPLVDPITKIGLGTIHIGHMTDVGLDPRVEALTEDFNKIMLE